jgi:hypothetical protein
VLLEWSLYLLALLTPYVYHSYDDILMCEVKACPTGFSKWEKTHIDSGDLTMAQFLEAFQKQTGKRCSMILHEEANKPGSPCAGRFLYDEDEPAKYKEFVRGRMV